MQNFVFLLPCDSVDRSTFCMKCSIASYQKCTSITTFTGPSWSWSYGSWIYNYLCNQCLSPLKLWVQTPFRQGVLDTTLCDKICQLLATGQWFSLDTLVFYTNKTDHHDITEILLKVALNIINQTKPSTPLQPYKTAKNYIQY
jgi:hypothetical protein